MSTSGAVAIVGIGCRFPGASGREAYWRLLAEGRCAIRDVPRERWDADAYYDPDPAAPYKMVTRRGGFLDRVDEFDPAFWRLSRREAERMDPQHRLLLEVTWEALEDAGLPREATAGSATGVWVGLSAYDYGRMQAVGAGDAFACYCSAFSIAANRLSYLFDWRGPSMTIDTACSSSLVATHLACESLARGESELAVVAGANLVLLPDLLVSFSKAGMMAPDGLCKTFDARANGYARSEGVGVVVLKPVERAVRDGDRIYAVVRGSAVNQDGRTNGLTAPNPRAQERVLRAAYARAGATADEIGYVEAHGTGTPLGDPIEVKALATVLAPAKRAERDGGDRRLLIGSVKSNIGHTESAAGVAGIIKTALAIHHGQIPPSLHFERPNPHIDFDALATEVVTSLRPWPAARPLGGVSSFGYGGTNAHVVLGPAPTGPSSAGAVESVRPWLLSLSARTPPELEDLARATIETRLGGDPAFGDLAATAALRRTHHEERVAVVAESSDEARRALREWLAGGAGLPTGVVAGHRAGRGAVAMPVLVFSGNGGQWVGMGRRLFETEPEFRRAIDECDEICRRAQGWSIADEIRRADPRLDRPSVVQPLVTALQIGLAAWWRAAGIEPAAIVGHSLGEVAAAHVAGALDLEDALRVVFARGKCLDDVAGRGAMLAVDADVEEATRLCQAAAAGEIEIALENGPRSLVLSGDAGALRALAGRLAAEGRWHRFLDVPLAYHSRAVEPVVPALRAALASLRPRAPSVPLVSSVFPELGAAELRLDDAYWAANLRRPVRFAAAIERLVGEGHELFVEIGPHPLVGAQIVEVLRARGKEGGAALPSSRRDADERRVLLGSLGALWCRGVAVKLAVAVPARARVAPLPTYPWRRQRCWISGELEGGANAPAAPAGTGHAIFGRPIEPAGVSDKIYFAGEVSAAPGSAFADHRVGGATLLPAAAVIEAALLAAGPAGAVAEVNLERAVVLSESEATALQIEVDGGSLALYARQPGGGPPWSRAATARLVSRDEDSAAVVDVASIEAALGEPRAGAGLYASLAAAGYAYGPAFRGVTEVRARGDQALGRLKPTVAVARDGARHVIHPATLDAAFHVLAALDSATTVNGTPLVPVHVERVEVGAAAGPVCWAWARRSASTGGAASGPVGMVADVDLLDGSGRAVVRVRGLRLAPLGRAPALRTDFLFDIVWNDAAAPSAESPRGRWVVVAGGDGDRDSARALATALERRSVPGVSVNVGCLDHEPSAEVEAVVFVAAASAHDAISDAPSDELELAGAAFRIARDLAEAPAVRARLFFVTRATRAVAPRDRVEARGSSLWGLGRTLAFEHPGLRSTCVDLGVELALDRGGATQTAADALAAALLDASDEDQIALRAPVDAPEVSFAAAQVRKLVARLKPAELPRAQRPRMPNATGSVIVTGGLGALGLRAAGVLIAEGARNVALWGRSPPSEAARAAIRALEEMGARVLVQGVDVADGARVRTAIAEVDAALGPVCGLVHAAGLVDNAALAVQDRPRLARVMAPKVAGAHHLAAALADRALELFVLYGSAAGVIGSPGQANYAAANAWLESFAHQLRGRGVPATCIGWGAWGEAGLAAADAQWSARIEALGFGIIAPDEGDALLARILRSPPAFVAAIPIDADRVARTLVARPPSLLRGLLTTTGARDGGAGAGASLGDELRALPADARRDRVRAAVAQLVAKVVGADPAALDCSAPLEDLGIDSLLALELRSRVESAFGQRLPGALLVSRPSIDAVANALGAAFDGAPPSSEATAAPDVSSAPAVKARQVARPAERWIVAPRRRVSSPSARLIVFAHAGGSAAGLLGWRKRLPADVELLAVQLPGRDERQAEPFARDATEIAQAVAGALVTEMDCPLGLFGHSFGALLAFECARALRRQAGVEPAFLLVASLRAPHLLAGGADSELPDAAFVERLRAYGGLPDAVASAPDFLRALLPRIRADMAVLERYRHSVEPPLEAPIFALAGAEDAALRMDALEAWRDHTRGPFEARTFPGGHFFLEASSDSVAALVKEALSVAEATQNTTGERAGA